VPTELVESFELKGFPEAVPVYRVLHRHRTQVVPDVFILIVGLRGFRRVARTGQADAIERVLEMLEARVNSAARENDGSVRCNDGDAYLLTFLEASRAAAAAAGFMRAWTGASDEKRSGCGIHLLLHRGTVNVFRSFLCGNGSAEAWRIMAVSRQDLADGESGLFATAPVRDALSGGPWHSQLRPVGGTPAPTKPSRSSARSSAGKFQRIAGNATSNLLCAETGIARAEEVACCR